MTNKIASATKIQRREFLQKMAGATAGITLASLGHAASVGAPTSGKKPRNIVWIMSDQHRWDVTGFSGNPVVQTPNLDRLAWEGACLANHYCQFSVCVASRTSMVTAQYPPTNGVTANADFHNMKNFRSRPTAIPALNQAGFTTMLCGKGHMPTMSFQDRLDIFEDYKDYVPDPIAAETAAAEEAYNQAYGIKSKKAPKEARLSAERNSKFIPFSILADHEREALIAGYVEKFLQKNAGKPFFMWVSFGLPHPPWMVPEPYNSRYKNRELPFPPYPFSKADFDMMHPALQNRVDHKSSPVEVHNCIRAYYAAVEFMDAQGGKVLAALQKHNVLDQSIIAYTSDHGEDLYNHGMWGKGDLYEGAAHVPALLWCPDLIKAGTVINRATENISLLPTLFDYAGVPFPAAIGGKPVDGHSLSDLIANPNIADDKVPDQAFCWLRWCYMVRRGPYKYIYYLPAKHAENFKHQLFDLSRDPAETRNLIDDPNCREIARDLKQRIERQFPHPWAQTSYEAE